MLAYISTAQLHSSLVQAIGSLYFLGAAPGRLTKYFVSCIQYAEIEEMDFKFREGEISDLKQLQKLALKSWSQYETDLSEENWKKLNSILTADITFSALLDQSYCLVCETNEKEIIGMAYLIPKGNPTEIYDEDWSYLRFVSVNPSFSGKGIGRELTEQCLQYAKATDENYVALHTSEMMYKARRLYENLGFRVLRQIEPRLGKRYWLYLLELNKGDE